MKINWNNKYATIAMYAFLVICGSILLYLGISHISSIKASINDFIRYITTIYYRRNTSIFIKLYFKIL